MNLTEKEKVVFEEYCKEIAELEKTENARYKELRKAIKNVIGEQAEFHFVFMKAFNLCDDKALNDANIGEIMLRFELTRERLRQIEAKALRRLRFLFNASRLASSLKDYLDSDILYVLVEDAVPEEEKAALQKTCQSFAKRINLQDVNLVFLDAPSEFEFELAFSYPDDSRLPKSLFDKNVLLISKSEPCLSWFERNCIIPRGEEDNLVPILEQAEILFPDEAHRTQDYHNTVFAYPSLSKVAWFKGTIILADEHFVPEKEDFDLLTKHFETKKRK